MFNQKFSILSPLINYIYSNSSPKIKLKLLKTCKQIERKLQLENHKFDIVIFLDFEKPKIRLYLENEKLHCQINPGFSLDAKFSARRIETKHFSILETYLPNINLNSIQELQVSNLSPIMFEKINSFLTPSLTSLEIPLLKFADGNENIALKILKEAPNLKNLEISIQNALPFTELADVERHVQFENVKFTFVTNEINVDDIAKFIKNQIAVGGNLQLHFMFPHFTKNFGNTLRDRNDEFHRKFIHIEEVLFINFVKQKCSFCFR